jgi:heme/copper-type cytochrome/quinol oxidase subunit 2
VRESEGLHLPVCNESDILRTSIMVYLKSFLVGVVALVSVLFLGIVGFIGWGVWISHRSSNQGSVGTVSYDVSSPWIGIPLLIVTGLIFLAGFSWEFRRATRANRPSG